MPHARIAADEQEAAKLATGPALFEQPEEPLDGHVHDVVGRLLARRQMQDMRDAANRPGRDLALRDGAVHDLEPIAGRQRAVMAQGANRSIGESRIAEQAVDDVAADLAGGAGDENETMGHGVTSESVRLSYGRGASFPACSLRPCEEASHLASVDARE